MVLFGYEIIRVIGTPKYYDSIDILGLIIWSQLLSVLTSFRSLGPEISNKTKYSFFISIGSFIVLVISLQIFTWLFGLVGVGLANSPLSTHQIYFTDSTFSEIVRYKIFSIKDIIFNFLIIFSIIIS